MALLTLLLITATLAASVHWSPEPDGAVEAYNLAVGALERGEPEVAEQHLRKALRRDPDCGMCGGALAMALLRQDKAPEAYERAAALAELFPNERPLSLTLAQAAFAVERFDESVRVAEALLLQDPGCIDSLNLLAQGLLRLGDTARARAALEQARPHHAPELLACELGKVDVEDGLLEQARAQLVLCRQAGYPLAVSVLESRILTAESRFGEAQEVLVSADVARVSAELGARQLMDQGDYAGAAVVLREVTKNEPHAVEAAVLLGRCELELERPEAAIDALSRAFEAETWVSVNRQGSVSGILTAGGEEAYLEIVHQGVGQLILLQARLGRTQDAQAILARAQAQLEPSGELAAAEVSLLAADGHAVEAAALVLESLARWPESAMLSRAAVDLAEGYPEANSAAMDRALVDLGGWFVPYNAATALFRAHDYTGCVARLDHIAPLEDPESWLLVAQLAHSCAATGGDLVAADRWLATLPGPGAAYEQGAANHALVLLDAGRVDEALGLAVAVPRPQEQAVLERVLLGVELGVMLAREDMDGAQAVVARGPVDPVLRYNLGAMLTNAQRLDEALVHVRAACPELTDPEARTVCEGVLAELEAASAP